MKPQPPPQRPPNAHLSAPPSGSFVPLRFRPIRFHARGGLGEVLVAEDVELVRTVAMKRIRPEQADSPDARARFLREAIVTARLDHPGVVPVYGCGSEPSTGRPYYAMRLIAGKPLSDAVAEFHRSSARNGGFKGLAFRQLITRFVGLCRTVGYAHSRGILHRDIKPSNVMLGEFGETLLVDWGLAYDLTGQLQSEIAAAGVAETLAAPPAAGPTGPSGPTRPGPEGRRLPTGSSGSLPPMRPPTDSRRGFGTPMLPVVADSAGSATQQGAGSPGYMSPEQAAGEVSKLGPTSDIYGLGSTLYHLLTGNAPLETESTLATVSRTMTGDIPPPRSVRRTVPLALDAICRKAMSLVPERRYRTAEGLAADLEAWLADQPVSCLPESASARTARWMREHPLTVGGVLAAVLVAAVAAGLVAVLVARQKSDLASNNQQLVTERTAAETARREAERQEKEAESARERAESAAAEASRQREAAVAQRAEADRLRTTAEANLRTAQDNFALARRAVAECLDLAREHPIFQRPGNQDAKSLLLETARRYHEKFRSTDGSSLTREEYVLAQMNAANEARDVGRVREAREAYLAAITELEKLAVEQPTELRHRMNLAAAHNNLALLLLDTHELDAAEVHFRRSIEMKRKIYEQRPDLPDSRGDLARGLSNLGSLLVENKRTDRGREVERLLQEAHRLQEKLLAEQPSNLMFALDQLRTLFSLGQMHFAFREYPESIAHIKKALDLSLRLAEAAPSDQRIRKELAAAYNNLGVAQRTAGLLDQAEPNLLKAVDLRLRLAEDNPSVAGFSSDLSATIMAIANLLAERNRPGDWAKAEKNYTIALKIQEELIAKRPGVGSYRAELTRTCWNLARLKSRQSEAATDGRARELLATEAVNWLRRAGPTWKEEAADNPDIAPLRGRTDYRALLVEWEAAGPPRRM